MTRRIFLLGCPVSHSVSPAFQQAALDNRGLESRYEAWEVQPGELGKAVSRLRDADVLGANVTVPHKETVVPHLDHVDSWARTVGAVNTIVNHGGSLTGFNTDGAGFIRALWEGVRFSPLRKRVVLLGAGGSARGVGFSVARGGASQVTVINRNVERAQALAEALKSEGAVTRSLEWSVKAIEGALGECDLVVNCTPIGMKRTVLEGRSPLDEVVIPSEILVYDLVYNPCITPLLQQAQAVGAKTVGGLPMLVYQGAASFQLWTRRKPPIRVMVRAAQQALGLNSASEE